MAMRECSYKGACIPAFARSCFHHDGDYISTENIFLSSPSHPSLPSVGRPMRAPQVTVNMVKVSAWMWIKMVVKVLYNGHFPWLIPGSHFSIDKLYTIQPGENELQLPSPEALKEKILVKVSKWDQPWQQHQLSVSVRYLSYSRSGFSS